MVFCNLCSASVMCAFDISHNPYFNRWFSAIIVDDNCLSLDESQSLF